MIIRESGIAAGVGWVLTTWAGWFTTDLVWRADQITSRQWLYLMSVPGHQWSWAGLFGSGVMLLVLGLVGTRYRLRAAGFALIAVGTGLIAGFYLAAPFIDPGLTTLGYHPWLLSMVVMLFCAVVNWRPVSWF